MLIKRIIEFKLRGLGPLDRTFSPTTSYLTYSIFMSKQNQGKSSSGLLFTTKIPIKFNPKLQNYKRIFDQIISKRSHKMHRAGQRFFELFCSHRQPSPWAKSSKQRCPALCILWLELLCSCRVGGWSGHLTASGSLYDFPGVDHEGRQTCRLVKGVLKQFNVF